MQDVQPLAVDDQSEETPISTSPHLLVERPDRTSDSADRSQLSTWQGRPVLAALVRASVFVVPLLVAFVVTRVLFRLAGAPATRLGELVLWVVVLIAGFFVAVAVERVTRRLLPVAMLMRLTLVFPDQAPSRFAVLRTASSPSRLKEIAESGDEQSGAAGQVLGLVAELARHDRHTRGHSERVRVFADLIAEELGIRGLDRDKLRWASLLHDIGKLEVPAAVLNKRDRPSSAEWAVLQGHPAAGEARSGALFGWLGEWAGGITEHHERWDGAGYPSGLAGEQITLSGRIVAVADAYETMTAARAYKKPMATAAARRELAACSGGQFDAQVVRAFLQVSLPKLLWRVGPLSFLAHLPFLNSVQMASQTALASLSAVAAPAAVAGLGAAAVAVSVLPAVASTPGDRPGVTAGTAGDEAGSARAETRPARTATGDPLPEVAGPLSLPAGVSVGSGAAADEGAGSQAGGAQAGGVPSEDSASAEAEAAAAARDRAAADAAAKDKAAADAVAKERADTAAKDEAARNKAAAEKAAAEKAAAERAAAERAAAEMAAAQRAAAEKAAAEKAAADAAARAAVASGP